MLTYIAAFIASALVVVGAGGFLTRSADAIAEGTGIGRAWVGAVALAAATSLPELATDVSAVRMRSPNLAAGDLFGSSLANMLILAVIDLFSGGVGVLRGTALENTLIGALAIVLNAMGALLVLMRSNWTVLSVSPGALLLLLVYLAGTRAVYRNGVRQAPEPAVKQARGARGLRRPMLRFAAATVAIFVAAPALAWSAGRLAELTGLGTTFLGTWLLGLLTSLPELVTSVAAVRIGALDLAVGNLFGSNSFNMVIFVALDLATPGGSIFPLLSPAHAITGGLAVILMALGLAGILYRAERRFVMLEPDSMLMVAAYLVSIWLVYKYSGVM